MNILLAMVPISIVFIGLAIWAFVWAVRRGQFDDLETPALDILLDDPAPATAAAPEPAPTQGTSHDAAVSAPDT